LQRDVSAVPAGGSRALKIAVFFSRRVIAQGGRMRSAAVAGIPLAGSRNACKRIDLDEHVRMNVKVLD